MNPRSPQRQDHPLVRRYGRWAVVTGASDGMGRGIARGLAQAGMNLVLVARREQALEALARELSGQWDVRTRVLSLDLSSVEAAEQVQAEVQELDVGLLVAAAGFGTSGPLIASDLDTELNVIDVNIRSLLAVVHPFARRFAARGRGGIVLFASLVGWQGAPFAANYAASKAYVQSLAEGLRVELAPNGVDVLVAAPGPVASGFAARAGMTMGKATPADRAARAIVASLGRRGTVIPGAFGKLLTWSLRTAPRPVRVRIMAGIMRGMSQDAAPARTAKPRTPGAAE